MDTAQTHKFDDSENSGMSSTVALNRIKKPLNMDVDEKSLKKFVKKNCWYIMLPVVIAQLVNYKLY